MSLDLIRRTFLTPPVVGNVQPAVLETRAPSKAGSQLFPLVQGLKTQTDQTNKPTKTMTTTTENTQVNGIDVDALTQAIEAIAADPALGIDSSVKPGYDSLRYTVHIKGDATAEQFEKVHEGDFA
jgi:hypothetical protein